MRRTLALLAGTACLALGCGGGGGAQVHPATQFRGNAPGDSWTYTVNINFGPFGAYTGSMVDSLTNDTYNGSPSIRDTQTFYLQLNTGPATITGYSEISPAGVLLAESVNAVLYAVVSDTFSLGPMIGPSTSATGVVTLSNGETVNESYEVIGASEVNTADGNFACWVISQQVTRSDGTSDNFRIWMAPETGNYVRITDTTKNPDGTGYTYTASLQSSIGASPAATRLRTLDAAIKRLAQTLRRSPLAP